MVELRFRVEVPVPPEVRVRLAGLTETVRPEGETAVARAIVPAKPFRLVKVIGAVLAAPVMTVTLDGPERPKSTTFTATVTAWESEPLVPVTVTVYVPIVVELRVSVDVAVPPLVKVALAGLKDAVGPEGETAEERVTVPVKL